MITEYLAHDRHCYSHSDFVIPILVIPVISEELDENITQL